jgi:UDP-N-acetylmuramoyl-tripeptide--D-alanyl-D-alanine ligase
VELTLAEIAAATAGELVGGAADTIVSSFSFDSRVLEPGACFVALRGSRDGHDFVAAAFARGAAAALVARLPDRPHGETSPGPLVVVSDPLAALAELGRVARNRLAAATVVGVTGSAGKTATKDLAAAAARPALAVHANEASYNNEFGLPLTLLGAPRETQIVIAEMGARFAGNITDLCEIARPDIGVVTHVGLAHAEHLGGPEGIASVKGELVEALPASGLAVLNADDPATAELARRTRARTVRVGIGGTGADVRARAVELDYELRPRFVLDTPWGTLFVALEVRGYHQVRNASMAATVALSLGVPPEAVAQGLTAATSAPWRMQLLRGPGGVTVLNDAYNASPTSVAAALESFERLPAGGRRIAVLGVMLELGPHSDEEHARVGELAAQAGIEVLVLVGEGAAPAAASARAAGVAVVEVDDVGAALDAAREHVRPGDAVLVKASRAIGLERLAEDLVTPDEPGSPRDEVPAR